MRKSYNPISDVSNEKNEITRRIYRSLTEVVCQLDDVRGRSLSVSNLFAPSLMPLKAKLHDLCHKLILTDPLGYGKKGEELLWRKGYHDMFITAKRLRKNDIWSAEDIINVQGLLMSGIGHYQHFLFQLQTDYGLNFQGVVDFPLNTCAFGLQKGENLTIANKDKNLVNWAEDACLRCLIYLGDLNRYLIDIYPLWDSGTAERYYTQAANINIKCGRPYNQLGTLAGRKNYNLDAVYNYVRCMICFEPFQGAEGNLKKALDKNAEFMQLEPFLPCPAPSIQKLIMKFLFFFDIWFFDKPLENNMHNLCHEMLQEFQYCLREENMNSLPLHYNEVEISNLTPFRDRSLDNSDHLTSDTTLKMIILVLICIDKLQKNDSQQASVVAAVGLAIFSQLLQHASEKFQQFLCRNASDAYSNGSQKSSSCDSRPETIRSEKFHEINLEEQDESQINGNVKKKNVKNLKKKGSKTSNCKKLDLPEINLNDEIKLKINHKKNTRLKRRKRIRPLGSDSQESDLSDSDLIFNDASSNDDCFSTDSDSEEEVFSESEDLDETLLIIDQKIKEKKIKEGMCKVESVVKAANNSTKEEDEAAGKLKNVNDTPDLEKITFENGLKVQNGIKSINEKDKAKSLFTISNGLKEDLSLSENNGGDFTFDEINANGNIFFASVTKENNELEDATRSSDSNTNLLKMRPADGKKFLHFLSQQGILKSIKLFCDWFQTDSKVLKACSKNSKSLPGKLVNFLNLIKFEEELFLKEWKKIKEKSRSIPLSEDIITRGLPMLEGEHSRLDWNYHKTNRITNHQENLVRLARFNDFGHYLCKIEELGILFNKESNIFYIAGKNDKTNDSAIETVSKKQTNSASLKGQLMKSMGQLWLKAEVRDLESRVRRKAGNFSPYLVVDSEALIEHIALVKQLVGSRQFIVIIPTVVLSHLDECKRDSGRARETIRWLESQFQHGNRSLRAQKSQERISLPLIKYPKKKDKEAWNFFQIVECCHYFSKQSEFQSSQSNLLVTLLTGQRGLTLPSDNKKDDFGKDYSPVGIAKNFGINLEHIETFHTKWKLSTKSHG